MLFLRVCTCKMFGIRFIDISFLCQQKAQGTGIFIPYLQMKNKCCLPLRTLTPVGQQWGHRVWILAVLLVWVVLLAKHLSVYIRHKQLFLSHKEMEK